MRFYMAMVPVINETRMTENRELQDLLFKMWEKVLSYDKSFEADLATLMTTQEFYELGKESRQRIIELRNSLVMQRESTEMIIGWLLEPLNGEIKS